jgi:hypothetical protein
VPSDIESAGPAVPKGVAEALAAAEIPPSKLGLARRARLSESERDLYFWILRRFGSEGRPNRRELDTAATRLGADPVDALQTLAREDLVHVDQTGEISVAYPFSGRPTAHRVRFPSGHEAYAMCAIDALGIAPMFSQPIEITSRDPSNSEVFEARLAPDGSGSWQPETAAVVAGALERRGDSCYGCCPVLNFFVTPTDAKRWLAEHPEVRGRVITIPDAIASGRAVFGDVLGIAVKKS